jgi:hypothetical protein
MPGTDFDKSPKQGPLAPQSVRRFGGADRSLRTRSFFFGSNEKSRAASKYIAINATTLSGAACARSGCARDQVSACRMAGRQCRGLQSNPETPLDLYSANLLLQSD